MSTFLEPYLLGHFFWTDPAQERVHQPGHACCGQAKAATAVLTNVGVHHVSVEQQANGLAGERDSERPKIREQRYSSDLFVPYCETTNTTE